jgi:periplasmic protein CpxP/Spy
MKVKVFFLAMLIAFGFSTVNAQQQQQPPQPPTGQMPRMNPEEMAKRQTERMVTDLKLNDKQKTDVEAINLKYAKLRGELFQANQGDWEAIRAKMQEMDTKKNAELEKVLTADQYKQYFEQEKKRQEERRQRMEQRQGQSGPGEDQRGKQRGGDEK